MYIFVAPAGDGLEPLLLLAGGVAAAGEGELLPLLFAAGEGLHAGELFAGEADGDEAAAGGLEELLLLLLLLLSAAGEGLHAGELPAGEDVGEETAGELLLFVLLLYDVLFPPLAPPAYRLHPGKMQTSTGKRLWP